MSQGRVKYPRTLHLPGSPGVHSDDRIARDLSALTGAEVVVSEKMDGENTTLYRDGFHARSLEDSYHPSRDWVAAFQGRIGHLIPEGWRICGENLFARHAIPYNDLPSYFLGFSAWDANNLCLPWDETGALFDDIGITPVPERARADFKLDSILGLAATLDTTRTEGLVIRTTAGFPYREFSRHVVKWVRPDHVQSEHHWRSRPLVRNKLRA